MMKEKYVIYNGTEFDQVIAITNSINEAKKYTKIFPNCEYDTAHVYDTSSLKHLYIVNVYKTNGEIINMYRDNCADYLDEYFTTPIKLCGSSTILRIIVNAENIDEATSIAETKYKQWKEKNL